MARPVWDTRRRAAGAVEMVAMEAMAMEGVGGRVGGGGGLGWEAVGSEGREGGGSYCLPGSKKDGPQNRPTCASNATWHLPFPGLTFLSLIPDQFRTGGPFSKKKKSSRAWPLPSDLCEDRQTGAVYAWSSFRVRIYGRAVPGPGRPSAGAGRGPGSGNVQIPADICTEHHITCRMSGMLLLCTPSD